MDYRRFFEEAIDQLHAESPELPGATMALHVRSPSGARTTILAWGTILM